MEKEAQEALRQGLRADMQELATPISSFLQPGAVVPLSEVAGQMECLRAENEYLKTRLAEYENERPKESRDDLERRFVLAAEIANSATAKAADVVRLSDSTWLAIFGYAVDRLRLVSSEDAAC